MFDTLAGKLGGILDRLRGRGALSEADVAEAMREVRRALIEADVALEVARGFIERVTARAVGADVIRSVTPGQMVVKIVHDELVAVLGADAQPIDLNAPAPVPILMAGLQGSGKTTTTAKLARRLTERMKRKVLHGLSRHPPPRRHGAARGARQGNRRRDVADRRRPVARCRSRAALSRRRGSPAYDVVLLDTAGRVTVDEALMNEVVEIERAVGAHETMLVADSLTGQDAVATARAFAARLNLTGIILTRVDGDGRGGAALSMRAVTGKPIKLIGTGESMDALEDFDPARIAGRILGMGDVVALVEKAAESVDLDKAKATAERMRRGAFDLNDLREQLIADGEDRRHERHARLMPGIAKMKKQIARPTSTTAWSSGRRRSSTSMTPQERRNPDILKASRKKRIAAGSGTKVEDINRLLKMHRQMADMMKAMGKRGGLGRLGNMLGMGGGAPSPEEMQKLAEKMPQLGGMPPNFPGLPGMPGKLPGLRQGSPASDRR